MASRRTYAAAETTDMTLCCAPVAQLDRAPGFEPVGRGFESLRARHFFISNIQRDCAPVAQLDRAFASGAKGRRFESCRARHFIAVDKLFLAKCYGPCQRGRSRLANVYL